MEHFLQDADKIELELAPELPTMKETEVEKPINCI
jgi:hypothetical protein